MSGAPLRIAAFDGYPLAATRHAPAPAPGGAPADGRGLALIARLPPAACGGSTTRSRPSSPNAVTTR